MNVIDIENLTRNYGRHVAVRNLSLRIPAGRVFGFLGPNGAGKSTTIRVLMGLLRATSGSARIFGRDAWSDGPRIKQDVGYVPGDLRLYRWMSARRAVAFLSRVRRCDLRKSGDDLCDLFELDASVTASRMSSGMRQKLGLILALVHRPKLLVLDEPSTGLDPIMQDRLKAHLESLSADGHTVFFSSHTLSEVEQLCAHVAILRRGELVVNEPLAALRERALRRVVIRWKADSGANGVEPPPFLRVHDRNAATWQADLTGPVMPLVRWTADRPIDDLSIGAPDLERLFKEHYEQEATA